MNSLDMNRPENKLVDGKTLRHVLILLKRIMELEGRLPDEGITIENTDSEQVKELVYNIVYGKQSPQARQRQGRHARKAKEKAVQA